MKAILKVGVLGAGLLLAVNVFAADDNTATASSGLTFSNVHAICKKVTDEECQTGVKNLSFGEYHNVTKTKKGLVSVKGKTSYTTKVNGKDLSGNVTFKGAQKVSGGPIIGTWKTHCCTGNFQDTNVPNAQ